MAHHAAGERRWHVTVPLAISSIALASMAHTMEHRPSLAFLALLVATLAWAPNGIMYSYPATFLQGAAAATGVALINSIANIGGMIGPYLIGRLLCLCSGHNSTKYAAEHANGYVSSYRVIINSFAHSNTSGQVPSFLALRVVSTGLNRRA